ncbi:hypothetical protein QBL02_13060 [Leucobacter sp. UT-8R-CII-1-4]|uniref:hypothetical protein n=1 Tax=Leucobacter sp. UT-8R-CII-1-4 TaxID=3040075 RepID=UPI0024A82245|nr:hypothetical protein [Leucobacter sp. UT-8R-CII-1-4]MDI6024470.1 hypothetical protein [Leucobacter sp. UT-8R-CII-1-4]
MSESARLLAYQAATEQVRSRLLMFTNTAWNSLGSYRDREIEQLVKMVVPRVQAGQIQVANLTAAHFRYVGATAAVDQRLVTGGRGIAADEVYRRPAHTVYTKLSEGKPLAEAVSAGLDRLGSLVSTDLQMAKVRQADRSLASAGVEAYRRVLTGRENCALCVIASTQRYHRGDLMPIHPGCDCSVDTLPAGWNPDVQVIDPALLDLTHDAIALHVGKSEAAARDLGIGKTDSRGNLLSDYTDLIISRERSEYGPTLSWRDHKFTRRSEIDALN